MVQNMKDSGIKIYSMVKAMKLGQIVLASKVNMLKDLSMEKVHINGVMVLCMKENGKTTRLTVM